jgi:glutamyl/glutaminyl-tRNA synthetase
VANALYVWGIARALAGRVILRIEDHDRGRCRPEYEASILEDLEWLGLEPDLGRPDELRSGPSPFRQSDREPVYVAALEGLASRSTVYACDCSRKEIAATDDGLGQSRYSGRCRERGLEPGPGRGLRLVIEEGEERFADGLLGQQRQEPARQCGDLLLRDRLGNWTYQFAVTVDDMEQDIDLVIRGEDLIESTGRQIRLARMLGRTTPPTFIHHPLIRHPSGSKLSKSSRDTGIRELRASGMTSAAVLGRAAYLTGLLRDPRELEVDRLAEIFRAYRSCS